MTKTLLPNPLHPTVTGLRHNVEGLVFLSGEELADRAVSELASLDGEGIEIPLERVAKTIN